MNQSYPVRGDNKRVHRGTVHSVKGKSLPNTVPGYALLRVSTSEGLHCNASAQRQGAKADQVPKQIRRNNRLASPLSLGSQN